MKNDTVGSEFSLLDCFGGIEYVKASFKDQHFSKHVHEGYAIGVIERGAQRFITRGTKHISGEGSLVIVNPDTAHTGEPASEDGWSYRAFYPTPEMFNSVLSDFPNLGHCAPYFNNPVIYDNSLIEHLRMIFDYADNHYPKLLLETLIFAFFTKLLIKSSKRNISLDERAASDKIYMAREYLDEYFDRNISLDDLATIGNTNKYTLIRQFKERWGMAPHQYQVQLRIHRAKSLLRTGIKPVDVAAVCGFYDQSHLSSHFKKALGTTPKSYRNFMYKRQSVLASFDRG